MAACALNVFPLVKEKALEENSFYWATKNAFFHSITLFL